MSVSSSRAPPASVHPLGTTPKKFTYSAIGETTVDADEKAAALAHEAALLKAREARVARDNAEADAAETGPLYLAMGQAAAISAAGEAFCALAIKGDAGAVKEKLLEVAFEAEKFNERPRVTANTARDDMRRIWPDGARYTLDVSPRHYVTRHGNAEALRQLRPQL